MLSCGLKGKPPRSLFAWAAGCWLRSLSRWETSRWLLLPGKNSMSGSSLKASPSVDRSLSKHHSLLEPSPAQMFILCPCREPHPLRRFSLSCNLTEGEHSSGVVSQARLNQTFKNWILGKGTEAPSHVLNELWSQEYYYTNSKATTFCYLLLKLLCVSVMG